MNRLVLEWVENNAGISQNRRETFTDTNPTRNPGTFRIGRDPQQCDLLINNNTVSRLHVEIYCDSQQQSFFLRNLAPNNVPVVNGQRVERQQVPLTPGSIISLGQVTFNVTDVFIEPQIERTLVVEPQIQPQRVPSRPGVGSAHPAAQQWGGNQQPGQYYPPHPVAQPYQPPHNPYHPQHQHLYEQHQHHPQHQNAYQTPQPPQPQGVPGLECPRCHKVSDYSHLDIGCPWCGTSLGAAVSILVPPDRLQR